MKLKLTKVMLVVGWIPVDKDTFEWVENGWPFPPIPARSGEPGFSFLSDGELIRGPWRAIQGMKF